MTQPAIKKRSAIEKRLDRYKIKTLKNLLKIYNVVYKTKEPFDFLCHDKLGLRYIKVETEMREDIAKEIIREFKKDCPPNTICEIWIFEKRQQEPKRLII